jgi:hypothetical protein
LCDPKFEKPPFFGFAMAPNKEWNTPLQRPAIFPLEDLMEHLCLFKDHQGWRSRWSRIEGKGECSIWQSVPFQHCSYAIL